MKKVNIATAVLFAAAIALIIAGIAVGEPAVVLSKAINVCMECIGIG